MFRWFCPSARVVPMFRWFCPLDDRQLVQNLPGKERVVSRLETALSMSADGAREGLGHRGVCVRVRMLSVWARGGVRGGRGRCSWPAPAMTSMM